MVLTCGSQTWLIIRIISEIKLRDGFFKFLATHLTNQSLWRQGPKICLFKKSSPDYYCKAKCSEVTTQFKLVISKNIISTFSYIHTYL